MTPTIAVGLDLGKEVKEDGGESAFLIYNLAVAKFQQRHLLQAGQLAARLLPLISSLQAQLARKVNNCHLFPDHSS